VVLHLLFLLAPPLLSKDIFNYIQYARIGAVHHLNPYTHGIGAAPFDPAYPYTCCHHYADPYGPLFTLGTYALAPLGVPATLWSLKTAVALAGLGCVALVWRGAQLQGRDPLAPALLVGLNPVWLVLTVGGAHNDLLMELFAVGGIVVWLAGRQASGAATLVVGLGTKISAAVVLPFMLLGSVRRLRALIAAGATALALFALWLGVFGTGALRGFGGAIGQQQELFSQRSIPQQLGALFDLGSRPQGIRVPLTLLLVGWVAWLLWRTWRGANWIAGAGWATFGVLATTAWLLPWYVCWLLPLAALGEDRRLRIAAGVATVYLIWARTPLILG
jgi:alpha-1,6-mannosyltransferase